MTTKKVAKKKTKRKKVSRKKAKVKVTKKKERVVSLPAGERSEQIIKAASLVAHRLRDFRAVTLDQVAEESGCCRALVIHYYKNATVLRDYILFNAIEKGLHHLVVQGIVHDDPMCKNLTKEQRKAAIDTLTN